MKTFMNSKNKSCYQCVSYNNDFSCGQSFEMLNKLNELENSNTCIEEHYNLYWNDAKNDKEIKNEKCDMIIDDIVDIMFDCCIQRSNKRLFSSPLKNLDRRILADQLLEIEDKIDYHLYILSSRINSYQCRAVYEKYVEKYDQNLIPFIEKTLLP